MRKILLIFFLCSFFASAYGQDFNLEAAKSYLKKEQSKLNLSKGDLDEMVTSSAYISPTTGWYHAYFNQSYQGVEVYNGILNVALKDGHLINVANSFVPNLAMQVGNTTSAQGITAQNISAKEAIVKSLAALNIQAVKLEQITQLNSFSNFKNEVVKYTFSSKSISNDPIEVKLLWYPYQKNNQGKSVPTVALTWNVSLMTKDKKSAWSVQVDAKTGEVLSTIDNVIKCYFGHKHTHDNAYEACQDLKTTASGQGASTPNSYNVFDYSVESPNHGSRSIVQNPYTKFVPANTGPGATNGWHHDGSNAFTDTRGNNVHAQDDVNADDAGGNRPNPANYTFDYPYTLGLNTAAANQNAAITNLFYWNNLIHDVLWKMGFDEPSGNFQANNMGRGGAGNDFVYADAQDGSGTNNANFYTPNDGSNPRMQMYLWNSPSTYQGDSDFDNGVIAHEYGHGWSTRLTGGPYNSTCLQNVEQGGEGWSDYLGLMLTTNWASLTPTVASAYIPRGIGTYLLGQPITGAGIRRYRYSYDMTNINSQVTYAAVGDTFFSQPHGIGSIWCTMLWDMTWEIILQDNAIEPNVFNTSNMIGNVAALKLVNEGLRLQPCSPSFVQARDAILAADRALFGGRYRCAIGRAFARRGLGLNASTGSSSNDRIVIADFTPLNGNALSSAWTTNACSGSPFQYAATSNISGTTFSWTRTAVAGITNPADSANSGIINETLINTTNAPITVNYVFKLSPNGCGQTGTVQQTMQVVVNPAAVQPTVASYNVCQNGAVPVGQGLAMPTNLVVNPVSDILTATEPTFTRPYTNSTSPFYYKVYTFVASVTGSVTFEITAGGFDTYLFLYGNSFNPASPTTNLLSANDDKDLSLLSLLTYNVVQGNLYYVVISSYNPLETGTFTLNTTSGGFNSTFNWYTAASGGSPIYSGSVFNPVGVAGSGISNAIAPIVKNYYVSQSNNPNCRATTTFSVTPANVEPTLSGVVSGSDTICAIFNGGVLTLSGHTGAVLGWESSEDNFQTWATTVGSSTYSYAGLLQSRKVRAILDRGNCTIARSAAATLEVITPMQNLTDSVKIDTVFKKVSLSITSQQKIDQSSKVSYVAGRNINLNQGFESVNGSVFTAEIVTNDCYIPVALTLQPDSTTGKDADISSLFPNTSFHVNKYLVPYNWLQFGNTEIRRSAIQFDLSSIPTNAVIDSAFLYLYFSQKFVQDNPPFTGHFGNNILEIRQITEAWQSASITWNNQPATTATGMVVLPAATAQTQDYPKINVKALVTNQFLNGNHGFMLKNQSETPYKITCLTASEETNATKRPKLLIYYRYQ
jgi:Fungalysin metallopeptidase (M36)/Fungalysin/Thermolysin Propeptide Motif